MKKKNSKIESPRYLAEGIRNTFLSGNRSFVSRCADGERSGFYVFSIADLRSRGRWKTRGGFSRDGNSRLATRAEPVRYVTPRRDFINPASISNRWPFSLTFSAHATRIKFIAIVARSRASAINRICRTLLCPRPPPLPPLWISWRCIVGRVVG